MAYFPTTIRKKIFKIFRPCVFPMILPILALVAGVLLFNLPDVYSGASSGAYADAPESISSQRAVAQSSYNDGNYKETFALFEKLLGQKDNDPANDPDNQPGMVGNDLNMAVNCLNNLNRQNETDALREKVIKQHEGNWQLLWSAAQNYQYTDHSGYMIAGKFERGSHRGGGKYVNAMDRDRVRALQLMAQAMKIAETAENKSLVAGFYQSFAGMWLLNRYNNQSSWELQAFTDLSKLPDYEDGYPYRGGETRGATVDESGNSVFYKTPESFESSINDGERWRWCQMMAVEKNPDLKDSVLWTMAGFYRQQFGVQTMASYGWWGRPADMGASGDTEEVNGMYSVHTLADIYTNRRMYKKAAAYWQQVLDFPNRSKSTY